MSANDSNKLAVAITEIDELKAEMKELQQWRASCNKWLAGWGSVCMFVTSCGWAIVHYYYDIKAFLLAFWSVKP